MTNISKDLGYSVEVKVFESEKIYHGDKVSLAPDIIFTINDWRCTIIKNFSKKFLFKKKSYSNRHTGSHRMDGIFIAYGPDIKEGFETNDVEIYAITPTILHLYNVPIPKDIDGRVLKEIFKANNKPKENQLDT